ncbi:unnamed protein product, partial [Dicrocoelium dendriticum]
MTMLLDFSLSGSTSGTIRQHTNLVMNAAIALKERQVIVVQIDQAFDGVSGVQLRIYIYSLLYLYLHEMCEISINIKYLDARSAHRRFGYGRSFVEWCWRALSAMSPTTSAYTRSQCSPSAHP